jgi:hypothetical protein
VDPSRRNSGNRRWSTGNWRSAPMLHGSRNGKAWAERFRGLWRNEHIAEQTPLLQKGPGEDGRLAIAAEVSAESLGTYCPFVMDRQGQANPHLFNFPGKNVFAPLERVSAWIYIYNYITHYICVYACVCIFPSPHTHTQCWDWTWVLRG